MNARDLTTERANRDHWNASTPDNSGWAGRGSRLWVSEPCWGTFETRESELGVFGTDGAAVAGKDLVELGCGTGYVSAWAARRGARPTGVDISATQLGVAAELQRRHRIEFHLVEAPAEAVPLPDDSFDVAISEHGAISWADPYRWIPEAARLLRPGGELIFIRTSTLLALCRPADDGAPATDRLAHGYADLDRILEDPHNESGPATYAPPPGKLVNLLRANGFDLRELTEFGAGSEPGSEFDFVSVEWARRWPSEELWRLRLREPE